MDGAALLPRLRTWASELGFSQIGVAGIDLASAEPGLRAWLDAGFQGTMAYMARHGLKRARPAELVPGTVSVITARMDYLPRTTTEGWQRVEFDRLARPGDATVSLYARGRDYHKVLRARLQAPRHVTPGDLEGYVNGIAQPLLASADGLFIDSTGTLSPPVSDAASADPIVRVDHLLSGLPTDQGDLAIMVLSKNGRGLAPPGGGSAFCFSGALYVDVDGDGSWTPWLAATQQVSE